VLTTNANELVADIHDRMPVILRREDFDRWLGVEPDAGCAQCRHEVLPAGNAR